MGVNIIDFQLRRIKELERIVDQQGKDLDRIAFEKQTYVDMVENLYNRLHKIHEIVFQLMRGRE